MDFSEKSGLFLKKVGAIFQNCHIEQTRIRQQREKARLQREKEERQKREEEEKQQAVKDEERKKNAIANMSGHYASQVKIWMKIQILRKFE